jgi:hypothetical protein
MRVIILSPVGSMTKVQASMPHLRHSHFCCYCLQGLYNGRLLRCPATSKLAGTGGQ